MDTRVPTSIAPMLAQKSEPFDHPEWAFEVKWDGIRALGFSAGGAAWQVQTRGLHWVAQQFPELEPLSALPTGTVLDGEIVVLRDGRPSLAAVLGRLNTSLPAKVRHACARKQATLMVFDCLYSGGVALVGRPFRERREEARRLVGTLGAESVLVPDYFVGQGVATFEATCGLGLEGIMAKRLDSRYLPGRRCRSWRKIKSPDYRPDAGGEGVRWRN